MYFPPQVMHWHLPMIQKIIFYPQAQKSINICTLVLKRTDGSEPSDSVGLLQILAGMIDSVSNPTFPYPGDWDRYSIAVDMDNWYNTPNKNEYSVTLMNRRWTLEMVDALYDTIRVLGKLHGWLIELEQPSQNPL